MPAAGHLRRAHPCRRRRHPSLLHAGRLRHRSGQGQGGARVPRPRARAGGSHHRRCRVDPRRPRRPLRQPDVPLRAGEFFARDGDRRTLHGGRGARDGRRADPAHRDRSARHLRATSRGGEWGGGTMTPLNRFQMAWRAAQDIQDGMVVNLGIGIPVLAGDYVPKDRDVFIQAENGIVGCGPLATPDQADADLVDAGSRRITLRPGAAIVDSTASFAMIRGGHIDVTVLGAFEVAANGDLANWDMRVPNKGPLVGGAMDLAACARAVWVIMEHTTRQGGARLRATCSLPLTAVRCVKRIYTDLAVVDVTPSGFLVREILDGISRDELQARSGAPLTFAPDCGALRAPPVGENNSLHALA